MPLTQKESRNVRLLGNSGLNGFRNGGQVTVLKRGGEYYAFVGHMQGMGTTIVNVTDPRKPKVISQIPVPENTHSHKVRVCGDVMLVNNEQLSGKKWEAGLRLYDISDPARPIETSFFQTAGKGVHRFWVDCDKKLAYISTEMDGYLKAIFVVVDFSNSRKPREVSRWWLPGQWTEGGEKPFWDTMKQSYHHHHPIVLGGRAYLGYWDAGFVILDVSDIRKPRLVSRGDYSPAYGGVFHTALPLDRPIMGRRWMIGFQESILPPAREGKKLMWVVDVTAEANPVPVATFDVPVKDPEKLDERFGPHQPHEDVHLKDNLVYAAWFGGGLRVVDISNPYQPKEVGYYLPRCECQKTVQTNDVYVDDRGLIYTIDRLERGLDILEYTGPRHGTK
jgi:hypothetical protein